MFERVVTVSRPPEKGLKLASKFLTDGRVQILPPRVSPVSG